jgi:hypothetical protein
MVKCRCAGLRGRRVDWLLWRLSNPVSNHYIYSMERKFNDFVVNKSVEDIFRKNILKSRDILSTHTIPPTYPGGSWKVKSLYTNFSYEVDRPYSKFACCSCPWDYAETFVSINVPLYYKIPIFPKIFF